MSRSFNLADELRKSGVPTVDTTEQIEYIPLDRIDPDPENFYSLEGIDELAGNIELVGLQQPLRVRSGERGHVIVVSGHRRRAACMLIRDGGSNMFDKGVPCIRERGDVSREMQELRLIYANSATRVLSGAELSKQAERVEELLYKLKEQGVVFPGRMRDHVAAAVNTSKSRIGRLHAIREKLDKPLLKLFDKGTINETVAYALSQQPVETQRKICDQYTITGRKLGDMPAHFVDKYVNLERKLASQKCKLNKGGLCINKQQIKDKVFDGSYSYKPCEYDSRGCCNGCSEYLRCKSRCPFLDEKAKAERAKKREARKDELAAEKAQKAADIRTVEQVWARYAQALAVAGETDADFRRKLKRSGEGYNPFDMYMDKKKVEALLDYSATDTKPNDPLPFRYSFKVEDYTYLCRFADALGVSLDYLFLRSDQPELAEQILNNLPTPNEVPTVGTKPTWQTGDPAEDAVGWYAVRVQAGGVAFTMRRYLWWTGGQFTRGPESSAPMVHKDDNVLGWFRLPDEEA